MIPRPTQPRDHKLGVNTDGGVGPDVALRVLRRALLLHPAERLNLVHLHTARRQVRQRVILIDRAGLAKFDQQLQHRSLRGASEAGSSPDGVAFAKGADDRTAKASPFCASILGDQGALIEAALRPLGRSNVRRFGLLIIPAHLKAEFRATCG